MRWSDGNEDNPRRIYLEGDVDVEAEFAPDCYTPYIPVERLYDWVLMLNVDSLHSAGWQFTEQDVAWYRVVDGIDAPAQWVDDERLYQGYYLTLDHSLRGTGDYYALVEVVAPSTIELCSTTIQTEVVHYSPSAQSGERQVTLAPTRPRLGAPIYISGLLSERTTHITVYDMTGHCLGEYTSSGEAEMQLRAEQVEGVYLVHVDDGDIYGIFKYVATK